MNALGILMVLSAVLSFFLGITVFKKNPSQKLNRWFCLSSFVTAIWIFTNFLPSVRPNVFWVKSGYAFGALVPAMVLLWVLILCKDKNFRIKSYTVLFAAFLFFIISYIDKLIVSNVTKVYLGGYDGAPGSLINFYFIYVIGVIGVIIYKLFTTYINSKKGEIFKIQVGYALLGVAFWGGIVVIVSFILPLFGIMKFVPLDSPSTVIFLIFTTIAITKYHLFDIKVVLTQTLIVIMGFLLLIQAFVADDLGARITAFAIFILFSVFGYFLIRSVMKEIELKNELNKANIELKKLDKAKTEFLSIASHQLRTPLTAINGYTEMLKDGMYGDISKEIREVLDKIFSSSQRLLNLVNSLLDISKIEIGRMEFKFGEARIEKIVKSVIDELAVNAEKKGLILCFKKPSKPLPAIKIDKEKIRHVILNLIDNAIKYTDHGKIEIRIEKGGFKIRIIIEDTGMGIRKMDIKHIFEMYKRGEGMRMFPEGSGLGLYAAKKFVHAHYGRIWAESPGVGKGAKFTLELPIARGK